MLPDAASRHCNAHLRNLVSQRASMGSSQSSQSKSAADLAAAPPPADAAPTVDAAAAAEPTTDPAPEPAPQHGEHDGEPLAAPSLEEELARLRELARKAMPSRAHAQQAAELEAFAGKRPVPPADECVAVDALRD